MKFADHLLSDKNTIKEVLTIINTIGLRSNVLFIVDEDLRLLGSITDGDVRRALINDVSINANVIEAMNPSCHYLVEQEVTNAAFREMREANITFVPVVDADRRLVNVLDLNEIEYVIPAETVLMAGGRGERMLPLTLDTPKSLLPVGDKPIIEHNIDRLVKFGIRRIHICINHLGDKIRDYFADGSSKGIKINYLREERPLGTIGGISLLEDVQHDTILLMNADLLTNIDFGGFYEEFVSSSADMAVASIPYHVDLPYAVMEIEDASIRSLQEKPRYTYFANAGIYLIKKELLEFIPKDSLYNSTDLVERVISERKRVISFPILGYWLDIGRVQDYAKARKDIKYLEL